MEVHLLRSGNIKRLQKYIRKKGVEKVIEEDYLNVLSNSLYGDFDLMGEWLQSVLNGNVWEKVDPKYQVAIQGAPFRIIDSERVTPKRLIKTMHTIIEHSKDRNIQGWLPWIIFTQEKTDEDVFESMGEDMFAYLFYESMDFAHRASGVKYSFREQMFESDRILLTARARYREYCLQALEKHLWKCTRIQNISDIGEIPPFMLVHRLGFDKLGEALVTVMDDEYLASVRDAYLSQLYEGMKEIPIYIYKAQKGNEEYEHSHDIEAYTFHEDDVPYLFDCPELVRHVSQVQPELFSIVTLFQMKEKGLALEEEFQKTLIEEGEEKIEEYWNLDSVFVVENAHHYGHLLGDRIRIDIFQSVLYEYGFDQKLIDATTHPFYVFDSMVSGFITFLLRQKEFDTLCSRVLDWRTGSKERQMIIDRQVFNRIRKGELTPENFGALCKHGFIQPKPCVKTIRKTYKTWDYLFSYICKDPYPYLEHYWGQHPNQEKDRYGHTLLMRAVMWFKRFENREKIWLLALSLEPEPLAKLEGGQTAFHLMGRDEAKRILESNKG